MLALSLLTGEIRWEIKTCSALKQRIDLVDPMEGSIDTTFLLKVKMLSIGDTGFESPPSTTY